LRQIEPLLTLGDIYGKELLYSPRASPNAATWLPHDDVLLDFLTAGQLTVTGEMPILCAEGASTQEGMQMLRDVGFSTPLICYRYKNADDYLHKLSELSCDGIKVAVQHVHPHEDLPPDCCWLAPSALSFLNNKKNLSALVPEKHLPRRRIIPVSRIKEETSGGEFPIVIKAVTDQSTGAGFDVVICNTPDDCVKAGEFFSICNEVVAEDYMVMKLNLCLNYAVTVEGSVTFLGAAEQVTDDLANYHGNWIDQESEAPQAAIDACTRVVKEGYARGFWGCVGIDTAIMDNDRVVIFDLNFRINASTAALLLTEKIRKVSGQKVFRLRSFKGKNSYREMLDMTYDAVHKGFLIPLGSYDPDVGGYPQMPPRLTGLVLGNSRAEVDDRIELLLNMGFKT
jgi:hypothetical protein